MVNRTQVVSGVGLQDVIIITSVIVFASNEDICISWCWGCPAGEGVCSVDVSGRQFKYLDAGQA